MCGYRELLREVREQCGFVSEQEELSLPDEMELQALWFSGQLGREFVTVDGREVKVVQFGHWNHAAGPDFLHTAVEIDGELRSGSLELDHSAAEWVSHGHAENEDFNAVVLHVVFSPARIERFTRTATTTHLDPRHR